MIVDEYIVYEALRKLNGETGLSGVNTVFLKYWNAVFGEKNRNLIIKIIKWSNILINEHSHYSIYRVFNTQKRLGTVKGENKKSI